MKIEPSSQAGHFGGFDVKMTLVLSVAFVFGPRPARLALEWSAFHLCSPSPSVSSMDLSQVRDWRICPNIAVNTFSLLGLRAGDCPHLAALAGLNSHSTVAR